MAIHLLKKKTEEEKEHILGLDPKSDLDYLLSHCKKNLHSYDEKLIKKAFNWCYDTHKNKIRYSGTPFYSHPVAVALIVVDEMPLDDISVASALLHNVIDEGDTFGLKDIQNEFGNTIAEIVEHITKIRYIEGHQFEHLENYRKMLLALFKDVRIILIKIADRLHNMRTLEHLNTEKQIKMSEETLEIFAPFAHRFGLGTLKWELEDLAFKFLNPIAYSEIDSELQLTRKQREEYIKEFSKPITEGLTKDEILKKKNIKFEMFGRPKHIYSIFNKMQLRGLPMKELFDLFAIRIILETDDSSYCFIVYGIISDIFKPVPGTFKDYISNPKKNSYQSLHTAVLAQDGKPVEVQIRTRKMHEVAERGVAAHFNYKRGFLPAQSVLDDKNIEEWMDLVRSVFEYAGDEPPEELLESVNNNLFNDEIFVFTPASEFRKFPKNSTPLDFAFAIHTEIGFHCIGAKVNGKVVPLNYKLESGDTIEILTSKNQKPSKEWLKCVVTQRARSIIQKYLKDEKKNSTEKGEKIWQGIVNRYAIVTDDGMMEDMLKNLKFKSPKDFYYAIGSSNLDIAVVYEYLVEKKRDLKFDNLNGFELIPNGNGQKPKESNDTISTKIKTASVNVSYAKCCNPIPGDEIIGHVKAGSEIVVHRKNCPQVKYLIGSHQPSVFEMDWSSLVHKDFTVKLRFTAEEKPSKFKDITTKVVSSVVSNFKGININHMDDGFEGILTVSVSGIDGLNSIFDKLKSIPGIKTVERYNE